jgi:glycerol dehydrogenase-like iron-containing ADH family enzyme
MMAFLNTGLRLVNLFEAPESALYAGLGDAAGRLPAYYVIKAAAPTR